MRHVAVALMEDHLKHVVEINRDEENDVFDLQAGHSTRTAQHYYARNNEQNEGLTRDMLYKYEMSSKEWQKFLGINQNRKSAQPMDSIDKTRAGRRSIRDLPSQSEPSEPSEPQLLHVNQLISIEDMAASRTWPKLRHRPGG